MRRENCHTISLFVAHKPGVLLRICLIFARRGFNIESLVVSGAIDGKFARMTVVAEGDYDDLGKIIKQLDKLVDVISCYQHVRKNVIETEAALMKISVNTQNRTEVLQIADHFKAETVDFSEEALILRVSGSTERLDSLEDMLSKYGILEIVRSGKMLMARGSEPT
jgi:acetolactate synthase I/III small subunit